MSHKAVLQALMLLTLPLSLCPPAPAQRERGELQMEVSGPTGLGLAAASAEIKSDANQFHRILLTDADGRCVLRGLSFGVYHLTVSHEGFLPAEQLVEVRSAIPIRVVVKLGLTPVATQVTVSESATLVDPNRVETIFTVGAQAISETIPAQPGRRLSDLIQDQPGWLYEANGTLHPRGSENEVQYVVDGLPRADNRAPAYASPFEAEDVESMRVRTAGFPAEFGRKLGGVVEMTTPNDPAGGFHGELAAGGGSFSTATGYLGLTYANGANRYGVSGDGFGSDRYLDPPVLPNYTNTGSSWGLAGSYEHDFSEGDRLRVTISHDTLSYLVPNELVQQEAGQRQNAASSETLGQAYFQHTISPDLLLSFSGSVRDNDTTLASNALSTPIIVSQDRGFREGYVRGDLAGHHGRHDWKTGADGLFSNVHEALQYTITDLTQFDPATQSPFAFAGHRWDREFSAYAQDQMRFGKWNVSAGLRFDYYNFVLSESAWSPRLGVSRFVPSLNLLVHASYDRIFQTPAMENLLLASSPQVDQISPGVLRLPVQPAHGNFYEIGVTKAAFGKLRIDANIFRRDFHNYADDDVLLDTGVSFPIAFASASITGEEVRIEVPHWGRFSGFVSFSNQTGTGQGPITGGLFLGSDAGSALTDTSKFAVSQDQRNTLRARVRYQASRRVWLAVSSEYGSGLPVQLDLSTVDAGSLLLQYGEAILSRLNFQRGRVRPNFSLDAAAGFNLYHKETRNISVQVQGNNLTNQVNVINFAGLFSGTAVAAPRSISMRLKAEF